MRLVRATAYFLRFYTGYTMTTLLQERATWFYYLLEQAFCIMAEERLAEIQANCSPSLKAEDLRSLISSYERMTKDSLQIEREKYDYSAIKELKKILKGKNG